MRCALLGPGLALTGPVLHGEGADIADSYGRKACIVGNELRPRPPPGYGLIHLVTRTAAIRNPAGPAAASTGATL